MLRSIQNGPVRRAFATSRAAWKKKTAPAQASTAANSTAAGSGFDAAEMKSQLEGVLKLFGERVKEAKASTVSTDKFQNLEVDLGQGTTSLLKTLAAIAPRGNKINIVAFDPKQVKHIQTAVVAQLGIPAVPFGDDKQTLSVSVPQESDARKSAAAKLIKEAYETLRNNAGTRQSIASVRAKYLTPLKKASQAKPGSGVSVNEVKKQMQEAEQLVKTYTSKLQDLFKKSS